MPFNHGLDMKQYCFDHAPNLALGLVDHGADMEKYCEVMHTEKRDPRCNVCRQKVALGKLSKKNAPKIGSGLPGVCGVTLPYVKSRWYGESPLAVEGRRSDAAWEQEMGRKWDRPYSSHFSYTGRMGGDKALLASLAPTPEQLEIAA